MEYNGITNTVLLTDSDRDAGGVYERDLTGALLREFHLTLAQTAIRSATRGPDGEVFGTNDTGVQGIVEWRPDGSVANTFGVGEYNPVRIIWAGNAPEPSNMVFAMSACALLFRRHRN